MLVDFKECQRSWRRYGSAVSNVQIVRMLCFRGVGEGTEMVLHAQGATAVVEMPPGAIVRLARGDIHQDVDGTAEKVGGDGDARGVGQVGVCEPAHTRRSDTGLCCANHGRISQTDVGVVVGRRVVASVVKDDVGRLNPEVDQHVAQLLVDRPFWTVGGGATNPVGFHSHSRGRPCLARGDPENRAPGLGGSGLLGELHRHLVEVGSNHGRIDRGVGGREAGVRGSAGEHLGIVAANDPFVVDGRIDRHTVDPHRPSRGLGRSPVEFQSTEAHRSCRANRSRLEKIAASRVWICGHCRVPLLMGFLLKHV